MKTRELHRYRKVSIGIFDEDNWYVADVSKAKKGKNKGGEILTNPKYYSSLDNLIERTAQRLSMREAESFTDFIESYQDAAKSLSDALTGLTRAKVLKNDLDPTSKTKRHQGAV